MVFKPPADWGPFDDTPYIKRVIGVGGETVEIREDGQVYIDGTALTEPYIYADETGEPQPTSADPDQSTWVDPGGRALPDG